LFDRYLSRLCISQYFIHEKCQPAVYIDDIGAVAHEAADSTSWIICRLNPVSNFRRCFPSIDSFSRDHPSRCLSRSHLPQILSFSLQSIGRSSLRAPSLADDNEMPQVPAVLPQVNCNISIVVSGKRHILGAAPRCPVMSTPDLQSKRDVSALSATNADELKR